MLAWRPSPPATLACQQPALKMLNPSLDFFAGALCVYFDTTGENMTGNHWRVRVVDKGPKLVIGTKFQVPNVSSTQNYWVQKIRKTMRIRACLSNQWQLQRSLTSSQPQYLQHIKNISLLQDILTTPSVLCWPWWRQNRLMVNLPLSHDRQTLPEHTANLAAGITASVNHLLWSRSLSETFRGATFCQRMRYLGEVIATVVSVTLGRLLTSWNMMRADSRGGKMAPDSHLWIYHLPTRQFGDAELYNYEKDLSMDCRSVQLHFRI